jgi:hypothetical protein
LLQALEIACKAKPAMRTSEPINAWLMNAGTVNETEAIGCIKAIVGNRQCGTQQRDSMLLEYMRMLLRLELHTSHPAVVLVPRANQHLEMM